MKIEISNLMTVKNYAKRENVTTSYIYKLIKEGKMSSFVIDGMQFIQVNVYPSIPVLQRRK
jgi:excisionase family DNA binding protein